MPPSPKRRRWFGDKGCFPVRTLTGTIRLVQQPRTRNARPYAGNGYFTDNCVKIQPNFAIPTVYLPMSFRPGAPVVSTRGEISLEVNRGFLSGRFLDYSLREFGLRRPLEMTYKGNVSTYLSDQDS